MVELVRMTEADFEVFATSSKTSYKQDKIRANGYTEEEANKIADDDFDRFLPDGYNSKENYLFSVLNSNIVVGYLWYLVRGADNNKKAYIADILIYEEHRGKGLGRETMLILEKHIKEQGLSHIGLHVFGFNDAAIKLYRSLNYQVTDLVMEKNLMTQRD